uniref:Uncharacterized protein n=1 Tax=Picea glauca TaxID=3330 RepID=A0A101M255_PICGL|nr:hypothetical protein ABT39_MTgene2910 [Picea glauca]
MAQSQCSYVNNMLDVLWWNDGNIINLFIGLMGELTPSLSGVYPVMWSLSSLGQWFYFWLFL